MITPRKLEAGLLDDRPFEEQWAESEAEFAGEPIAPLTAEARARLQSLGVPLAAD